MNWFVTGLLVLALLAAVGGLIFFAFSDWQRYQQRGIRRNYRYRRSAHERFALARAASREAPDDLPEPPKIPPTPVSAPLPRRHAVAGDDIDLAPPQRRVAPQTNEDDLLRDLLGQ